jgi:hypothetical protein
MIAEIQAYVQHFAAATATNQPYKAPNVKLPEFSGKTGEKVEEWLFSIGLCFKALHVPETDRITLAAAVLRGSALTWWRSVAGAPNSTPPTVWEEFGKAITRAFGTVNPVRSARDKLAALRQTTSVSSYANTFRNLALEIPDFHESEKLDRFIRGLKPQTQREVILRDPSTFEEAVNLADRYDSIAYAIQRNSYHSADTRRSSYPSTDGATSMELGTLTAKSPPSTTAKQRYTKLTPELRQQLIREGKCLYCRQPGHISLNCPNKSKTAPNGRQQ